METAKSPTVLAISPCHFQCATKIGTIRRVSHLLSTFMVFLGKTSHANYLEIKCNLRWLSLVFKFYVIGVRFSLVHVIHVKHVIQLSYKQKSCKITLTRKTVLQTRNRNRKKPRRLHSNSNDFLFASGKLFRYMSKSKLRWKLRGTLTSVPCTLYAG